MQNISITKARENLPKIAEEVYFKGKTFVITKRGIPMAKITKTDKAKAKKKYTAKDRGKAIDELAGIWKGRWKGKSTVEVVRELREKAWSSHAS